MISDKAQKMARDVLLTNIYNMSTSNWSPNNHLTNTVGESKSVTDSQTVIQSESIDKLLLGAKKYECAYVRMCVSM